jgi:hypothetical protein
MSTGLPCRPTTIRNPQFSYHFPRLVPLTAETKIPFFPLVYFPHLIKLRLPHIILVGKRAPQLPVVFRAYCLEIRLSPAFNLQHLHATHLLIVISFSDTAEPVRDPNATL